MWSTCTAHRYFWMFTYISTLVGLGNPARAQDAVVNPDLNPRYLTMCYLIERNTSGMIYDYNKAAAALDLAMDYSNNFILPPEIQLRSTYRNLGRRCMAKSHIVAHAQGLKEDGIDCHVYIGPGSFLDLSDCLNN